MPDPRAQRDVERLKQKSHELGDTAKDSVHNKLQQGQDKVDEYRVCAVIFRVVLRRETDRSIFHAGIRKGEARENTSGS
jgi:hypothetical protein